MVLLCLKRVNLVPVDIIGLSVSLALIRQGTLLIAAKIIVVILLTTVAPVVLDEIVVVVVHDVVPVLANDVHGREDVERVVHSPLHILKVDLLSILS